MRRIAASLTLAAALLALALAAPAHAHHGKHPLPHGNGPLAVLVAIDHVFPNGPARAWARRIAECESGGTYSNRVVGSSGEVSAFQVHPIHWSQTKTFWIRGKPVKKYVTRRNLQRWPVFAARWAFAHSGGGKHWSAWTCARYVGAPR